MERMRRLADMHQGACTCVDRPYRAKFEPNAIVPDAAMRPNLSGIDEISIGAGHRYLTIVLDLQSGVATFVGDGKGADALKSFWQRLKCSGPAESGT